MSSQQNTGIKKRQSLLVGLLGFFVVAMAAYYFYLALEQYKNKPTPPEAYSYSITQALSSNVKYLDSSFFTDGPSSENTAYVADLTDSIDARYTMRYAASKSSSLTANYDVTARVKANYAVGGDTDQSSNVWTKEYLIKEPTSKSLDTAHINEVIDVSIPYAEYKKVANDFRTALALPTTSEVVVTFTYRINGSVDGMPINDIKTSTLVAPLDQQLYRPALKTEKEFKKDVVATNDIAEVNRKILIQLAIWALAMTTGLAMIGYGLRKKIFKTPYQRELEKIYRYHDGVIVRTKHPVDISDDKIVPMRSFDDMLNLEEELKVPIVANEISSTTTEFMIVNSGVVYRYTLSDDSSSRSSSVRGMTREAIKAPREAPIHRERVVDAPVRPHSRKSIRVDEPSLEDIVEELAHDRRSSKKK